MPRAIATPEQLLTARLYIRDERRAELAASGQRMSPDEAAFNGRMIREAEEAVRRAELRVSVMPPRAMR